MSPTGLVPAGGGLELYFRVWSAGICLCVQSRRTSAPYHSQDLGVHLVKVWSTASLRGSSCGGFDSHTHPCASGMLSRFAH